MTEFLKRPGMFTSQTPPKRTAGGLFKPRHNVRCPYCGREVEMRHEAPRANARVPIKFVCRKHGTLDRVVNTIEG